MNAYQYKAISRSGVTVNGVIEAYDEFEAVAQIKQEYPIVVKVDQLPQKKARFDLNEPLWINEKSLSMVCTQFSVLLRAGLPMVRAVELIAEQTNDRLLRRILRETAKDVASGYSLTRGFEKNSKKIPEVFLETVRAGEESGTLEASFAKLSSYFHKSYEVKRKVRAAMAYPVFLCALAAVVIAIIMVVTVPKMQGVFDSFGGTLPLATRILIGMANGITHWWWLVFIIIAMVVIGTKLYGRTEQGKRQLAILALRMPVLGKIHLLNGASQFANTMSTLLIAGLSVSRALYATGRVMDNYEMGRAVSSAVVGIEEGKRLGTVLKDDRFLPPILKEMTAVGEEAGTLDDMLGTMGEYFDNELANASQKALSMLEPAITVMMGALIGFIVVALYFPMFTMYAGMGNAMGL